MRKVNQMVQTAAQAGLPAIGSIQARILILGSMPSVASLAAQAYYAHPRNAFWSIIQAVFKAGECETDKARRELLEQHAIRVWDVIAQAKRQGSLDSAIEADGLVINNFDFLQEANTSVQRILCNGAKAHQLFTKHVAKPLNLQQQLIQMPSTSPAHASLSFEQKLAVWQQALVF